jgi:hypothetical protein
MVQAAACCDAAQHCCPNGASVGLISMSLSEDISMWLTIKLRQIGGAALLGW